MPIITQAEARQAIPTLTSDDTTLALVITRVEQAFARHLGFPPPSAGGAPGLISYAVVIYNDGESHHLTVDGRTLRLHVRPVSSIVVYQDTAEAYGVDTVVSSSDYSTDLERGLVRLDVDASTSWYDIERAIKVTCSVGWATIPEDLKAAAIETVAHMWRRRGVGATDAAPELDVSIPGVALDLLAPYRLASGWVS